MSEMGHKRKSRFGEGMSGFGGKVDIKFAGRNVRLLPEVAVHISDEIGIYGGTPPL